MERPLVSTEGFFFTFGGIRNFLFNTRNSAAFWLWNFAEFRAFSQSEFRINNTSWSYLVSPLEFKKQPTIFHTDKRVYTTEAFPALCLHYWGFDFTWTCLHHRGLSCTWPCFTKGAYFVLVCETEFRKIPRNFRQFRTDYGRYGNKKNTEFLIFLIKGFLLSIMYLTLCRYWCDRMIVHSYANNHN